LRQEDHSTQLTATSISLDIGILEYLKTEDYEAIFTHDEADVIMVSCLLQAVENQKRTLRKLIDVTNVFILLIYWCWKMQLQSSEQL